MTDEERSQARDLDAESPWWRAGDGNIPQHALQKAPEKLPEKRRIGRPRKLEPGVESKTLSAHFSVVMAKHIAVRAALDEVSVSEWIKRAAEEKLERQGVSGFF